VSRFDQLRFQIIESMTMTPYESKNVTTYVLGFAFDVDRKFESVCLIEKQKPTWQAGLLNGVGGKVEEQDKLTEITPPARQARRAMAREFLEETGATIHEDLWHRFFVMRFDNGAVVHCFTAHLPDDQMPQTTETERVDMYAVHEGGAWFLRFPIVPNLRWLIPMAYQELKLPPHERIVTFRE
jgi:8-oxo-dGTP diphosphatase